MRNLLGFVCAIAAFCNYNSAMAQEVKVLPANKVFGFYDKFLALPAQSRDHIKVEYSIFGDISKLKALNLIYKGQKYKLNLDAKGKILNLPTYDAVKNGQVEIITTAKTGKSGISVEASPNLPFDQRLSVALIIDALSDFRSSMSVAGPLAVLIPKQNSIKFVGVNKGNAVFADGRKVPISENDKGLLFNPSLGKYKGATLIELEKSPSNLEYAK